MLLQRLIADDRTGFGYDLVGSLVYDHVATRKGRIALASAFLDRQIAAKITLFVEVHGRLRNDPVKTAVLASKTKIEKIAGIMPIRVTDEPFFTRDPKIIGWMNVGHDHPEPMLIVRSDVSDAMERVDTFMKSFIIALKAERAVSVE